MCRLVRLSLLLDETASGSWTSPRLTLASVKMSIGISRFLTLISLRSEDLERAESAFWLRSREFMLYRQVEPGLVTSISTFVFKILGMIRFFRVILMIYGVLRSFEFCPLRDLSRRWLNLSIYRLVLFLCFFGAYWISERSNFGTALLTLFEVVCY